MKIAVIGGGSTYTPELINGFLARVSSFPLSELWLVDIDPVRLAVVGGFAQRMVTAKGSPFKVVLTTDRQKAIEGAAYITTQLRVGQMKARREDEYLGLRHSLVGQETTGVGGMSNALRTIPVLLDIAKDVREYAAPNALMANFTNPAGLVTQALSKYAPEVQAVGVCNVPITAKMMILEILEKELKTHLNPSQAELKTLGLNHLSWHCGFTLDGEDVWPQVINATVNQLRSEEDPEWEPELIENLQMIPNYYLHYFYHTEHKIQEQQKWPPSRAEEVMEVEKDLLREYADPELNEPPADLMKRGGAYYSTVATQLLNAHYNNLDENHIVNYRQSGAVEGWPADWVLEMPCKVNRLGIHPNPAIPLPAACYNLLAQVKEYELLTVEAAVKGDRNNLYEALAAHPLGPKMDEIHAVADDILATNREYLPNFWK